MSLATSISKYDVPGPRYTSYPTVPYWSRSPTEAEWVTHVGDALQRGRAAGEGASLYVHIPFCRSLCHYCGCNTSITRDLSVAGPYVDRVLRELDLYVGKLGRFRVDELHFGGGTPTFLPAEELGRLVSGLASRLDFSPTAGRSIEVDPRVTTPEQLDVLAAHGFKRISLGVQDFDPEVQFTVHRLQSVDEVRAVTLAARARGFESVNFDLIYGLPKQTEQSVRATVERVLELRPDRIAFYGYAHVPWMKKVQRRFEDIDVPGGPAKRRLYEVGREALEAGGYRELGMDHFALETDALWAASREGRMHRNFMGYTERRTVPLLGLGVSSIGDTWTAFAQNEKDLAQWERRVDAGELPIARGHILDDEDEAIRTHILALMTRFETDFGADAGRVPYLDVARQRLSELVADGFVEVDGPRVKVTESGRPFVRNVCMAFDARLARQAPDKPLFSRTV